jgi:hypothetical protein
LNCSANAEIYTRKEIDALIDWVKRPQVGASGMVYVNVMRNVKSSVDKFYDQEDLEIGLKLLSKSRRYDFCAFWSS